jgi:hypothetical protein
MRNGASLSQLLQLSSLPRGARMVRVVSMRVGAVMGWLPAGQRSIIATRLRADRQGKTARTVLAQAACPASFRH